MTYGKPPFSAYTNVIQKLQKIIDEKYEISYPPVENPFLIDAIQGCLRRDPKQRLTIPQLMAHPFLKPDEMIAKLLRKLNES